MQRSLHKKTVLCVALPDTESNRKSLLLRDSSVFVQQIKLIFVQAIRCEQKRLYNKRLLEYGYRGRFYMDHPLDK